MAPLASGQQARRSAVRAGRVTLVAAAVFLLGLVAIFAHDAKATPQSVMGFSQIVGTTGASTPGDDGRVVCPGCRRLVCTNPKDVWADPPSDGALSPAEAGPMPVNRSVRLSRARAQDAPAPIFATSFEPRGPPFVD